MNINPKEEAKRVFPEACEIRHHIHSYPELGEEEERTSEFVMSKLSEYGIEFTDDVPGYGIVGQIGHGEKAIAFRAELDALPVCEETAGFMHERTGLLQNEMAECDSWESKNPGVMHACGHDVHMATLLGAAKVLKEHEDELDASGYSVKLLFQPAEETIGGADRMVKAGFMENPHVERVFALHVSPNHPLGTISLKNGPMNAGVQDFDLIVKGKSAHGAHPEGGVDSIVVASSIVLALQSISSRATSPTTPIVVTIGAIHGGETHNILAGEVKLTGTLRTLTDELRDENKARIEQLASMTAAAYGAEVEFNWYDTVFPALINAPDSTDIVRKCMSDLYGSENIHEMPEPSMGGDDFAFFSQVAPGTLFDIGTATSGTLPGEANYYGLHSEHYLPPDAVMEIGIALELAIVNEIICN